MTRRPAIRSRTLGGKCFSGPFCGLRLLYYLYLYLKLWAIQDSASLHVRAFLFVTLRPGPACTRRSQVLTLAFGIPPLLRSPGPSWVLVRLGGKA